MISGTYVPISIIISAKAAYLIVYLISIVGIMLKIFYAGNLKEFQR